ncbi:MAG: 5-nucleotidase SurE [Verrucomicrobiota bacterium]|jgi:5'-nucleotidase
MHILLCNDDSLSSPLLAIVAAVFGEGHRLSIVAPLEEQSWTGKAMSRWETLSLNQTELAGYPAFTLDGRPADCVNWGIHHAPAGRPDLVVSGINIGHNCGLGFLFSSGTIGAALEANIQGLPALALSRLMRPEDYQEWARHRCFSSATLDRILPQCRAVLEKIELELLCRPGFLSDPVTWCIDLPEQLAPDWRLRPARRGHSWYGSLFERRDDGLWRHHLKSYVQEEASDADGPCVRAGHVAVSRIDLRQLGQVVPDFES